MAEEVYDDPKILTVFLPDGEKVLYKCDSRCPMMDLLVQITSIAKLKPTGFEIQPLSHDAEDATVLPFNPNTQIGAIDTQVVRIAPRTSGSSKYRLNKAADHNRSGPAISSSNSTNFKNRVNDFNNLSGTSAIKICNNAESMHQLSQPIIPSRNNYIASTLTPVVSGGTIGASCRVRVRLPRGQIHILRAAPQYPLQELYDLVCDERQLSPSKHVLVYTDDVSKEVNLSQTLRECGTTELTMKALVESSPTNTNVPKRSQHSSNIFSFLKKTLKKPAPSHAHHNGTSSQESSRRSSGTSSLPEATASNGTRPYSMGSMERLPHLHFTQINPMPNKRDDEMKKPSVPKVPLRTAKRQAPRPPSIVVTQINDLKDGSPTDDAMPWQDSAPRRLSQHSSDTGSAENSSVPSTLMRHRDRNHLPRAVSMGALDGSAPPRAMPRKKRAAPTPPMRMSHEDLRSSALFDVQLCEKLDNIEERDTKPEFTENPDPIAASPVTYEETYNIQQEVVPAQRKSIKEYVHVEVNIISHEVPAKSLVPEENVHEETISHEVEFSNETTNSQDEFILERNSHERIDISNEIPTEKHISSEEKTAGILQKEERIDVDHNANNFSRNTLDISYSNDPVDATIPVEVEIAAKNIDSIDGNSSLHTDTIVEQTHQDILNEQKDVSDWRTPSPLSEYSNNDSTLNISSGYESITQERGIINDIPEDILYEAMSVSHQSHMKENNNVTTLNIKDVIISDKPFSEEESSHTVEITGMVGETPNNSPEEKDISPIMTEKIGGKRQNEGNAMKSEKENMCANNLVLEDIRRQESREKGHKQFSESLNDKQLNNNSTRIYVGNNPTHETTVSSKPIIIEEVYKSPIVVEMLEYQNKTKIETMNSFNNNEHNVFDNKSSVYDDKHILYDDKHNIYDDKHNIYDNKHIVNDDKHNVYDNENSFGDNKHRVEINHDSSNNKHIFDGNDDFKQHRVTVDSVFENNVNGVTKKETKSGNDVVDNAKLFSAPPPRRIYTPPKFMLTTWMDDKRPTNGSWETEENVEKTVNKNCVNSTTPPNSPAEAAPVMSPTKIAPKTLPKTAHTIVNNTNNKIVSNNKELPKDRIIPQVVGVIRRHPYNSNSANDVKSNTNRMSLGCESELTTAKKLLRPVRTNSINGSAEPPKVVSNGTGASANDKTALHAELLTHFVKRQPSNVTSSTDKPKQATKKNEAPLNYMVSLPNYHNQAWRDRVPIMKPVFGKQLSMKDVAQVVKPIHADNNQSQMYAANRELSDSPPSWILVKDANNLIKRNQSFGRNN